MNTMVDTTTDVRKKEASEATLATVNNKVSVANKALVKTATARTRVSEEEAVSESTNAEVVAMAMNNVWEVDSAATLSEEVK